MSPDPAKGQEFMKAVVKASLWGLFAIGVRSQQNIDKFVVAFTENLNKSLERMGLNKSGWSKPDTIDQPESDVPIKPEEQSETTDLSLTDLDPEIVKLLKSAGINTPDELTMEMQKRDLKEIKGIDDKSVDKIRKAVAGWTK